MDAYSRSLPGDLDLHGLVLLGRFFELYDQMLGEVDITQVLHQTTRLVRQILDADRATTYLVRGDRQELESVAVIGNVSRTIRIPIGPGSLAGFCALTGRSFVVPDAHGDLSGIHPKLRFDASWDDRNQYHTRDVMCAPAVFQGEVLGVVQVLNGRGGPFCEADLPPLQSLSRAVAYALYHARLYDELATLQGLEREKARFMRILVHELRSPVTASRSLAAALCYANQEDEQLGFVLGRIEDRMDQLLSLVDDILQLSRIKDGGPLGEIVVCDLVAQTRTGCEPYLEEAQARELALKVHLPETLVPVRIDLQAYHLILSNLLSNALKYTPAGSVHVALRREDPWAVLEVQDTGIGIPQDDVPRLFTEFFRAKNARRARIQGTGVGLAGVKELVERFDGELAVASQQDQGSTFTVRLPLHLASDLP